MDVKIRDSKFKLEKISIYISDLYVEYVVMRNEIATADGDFEEIRIACEIEREEAETKVGRLKADLKMIKEAKRIKSESAKNALKTTEKRNQILKEIVELNGYEYIESDWLKNFSEDQFGDLIAEMIGKNKKKATESLS